VMKNKKKSRHVVTTTINKIKFLDIYFKTLICASINPGNRF